MRSHSSPGRPRTALLTLPFLLLPVILASIAHGHAQVGSLHPWSSEPGGSPRTESVPVTDDMDGDGYPSAQDCDDADPAIYPGAPQICGDGVNNDCDDPLWPAVTDPNDSDDDHDGFSECQGDCDDYTSWSYPGATEICDWLDNDCDGSLPPEEIDADGDYVRPCEGDCDDSDPLISPWETERCNRIDDNCDGIVPQDEIDSDGDGWLACDEHGYCEPGAMHWCEYDCDGGNPNVFPLAPEVCDGVLNNCTCETEWTWFGTCITEDEDYDDDGYSICQGDCEDWRSSVSPGATEIIDGLDNDCDGTVDEFTPEDDECVPIPDGLLAWWPGDGTAQDMAGSQHGILHGGTTFAEGAVGSAFALDGVNDFIGVASPVTTSAPYTVVLWVKPDDPWRLGPDQFVLSNGGQSAQGSGLYLSLEHAYWRFGGHDEAGVGVCLAAGVLPPYSAVSPHWAHLALSWDGTTAPDAMTLYNNGEVARSESPRPGCGSGPTSNLLVGAAGAPSGSGQVGHFAGLIDELAVFDRVLSPEEIDAIFRAETAGFCRDTDGDGYEPPLDCDETNPAINPGALDLPGNLVDENCDGDLGACSPCNDWWFRGQYIRCVAREVSSLVEAGLLSATEGDALVRSAALSGIGRRGSPTPPQCTPEGVSRGPRRPSPRDWEQ